MALIYCLAQNQRSCGASLAPQQRQHHLFQLGSGSRRRGPIRVGLRNATCVYGHARSTPGMSSRSVHARDRGAQRSNRVWTMLMIALGAAVGANLRYALSLWAARQWGAAFPYGTLLINVAGSFVIGIVMVLLTTRFST